MRNFPTSPDRSASAAERIRRRFTRFSILEIWSSVIINVTINLIYLTSCARTRSFYSNIVIFCNIFSVLSKTEWAKRIINLLLLDNFYPVMSYRRVQGKKKATDYCTRFGRSLWSAISCPAQVVNMRTLNDTSASTFGSVAPLY